MNNDVAFVRLNVSIISIYSKRNITENTGNHIIRDIIYYLRNSKHDYFKRIYLYHKGNHRKYSVFIIAVLIIPSNAHNIVHHIAFDLYLSSFTYSSKVEKSTYNLYHIYPYKNAQNYKKRSKARISAIL